MGNDFKKVVGLQYEPEQGVPRVILKGSGALAEEILRNRNMQHSPQIIENSALLEQLYRLPLDSEIGPELYRLVAIILVHVFAVEEQLKGKKID
jgi:type III secretion system FlhB-like substrate exporter